MKAMKWKIFATLVVGLGLAACDPLPSMERQSLEP